MAAHRNSERISLKLQDHPALSLCLTDPTMRVLVLCTAGNAGVQEIAFPYQCELKVNGEDIKANLRGLKNKPGSTRPVDITAELRLKPAYANNVELTYALTQKVGDASHSRGSQVRIGRGQRERFADNLRRSSTCAWSWPSLSPSQPLSARSRRRSAKSRSWPRVSGLRFGVANSP